LIVPAAAQENYEIQVYGADTVEPAPPWWSCTAISPLDSFWVTASQHSPGFTGRRQKIISGLAHKPKGRPATQAAFCSRENRSNGGVTPSKLYGEILWVPKAGCQDFSP
jgi:hypothetical protein